MLSRMHQKLGTAGFIIAIVALVAALGGGAYAAQAKLNSTQKKEVKKIAQTEASKIVPATGPAGPQGPAGPAGAKGDAGAAGAAGTNGTSPEGTAFTGSKTVGAVTCTEGGIEYKGASTSLVCNGKKGNNGLEGPEGPAGEDGQPWVPNGTLPTGATETGTWGGYSETAGSFMYDISFMVPLATAPTAVLVGTSEAAKAQGVTEGCPGLVNGIPTATAGKLCVYAGWMEGGEFLGTVDPTDEEIAGPPAKSGSLLFIGCAAECVTFGTWAVKAP
jgi:hypothetical protein